MRAVHSFFVRAKEKGIWEKIMNKLVLNARNKPNKPSNPTACIIDSQSVKTLSAFDKKGIDGSKKNKGT